VERRQQTKKRRADIKPRGRVRTHWSGCWRVHHDCAVARVERLEKALKEIEDIIEGDASLSTWDFNRVLRIVKATKEVL